MSFEKLFNLINHEDKNKYCSHNHTNKQHKRKIALDRKWQPSERTNTKWRLSHWVLAKESENNFTMHKTYFRKIVFLPSHAHFFTAYQTLSVS